MMFDENEYNDYTIQHNDIFAIIILWELGISAT